MTRWTNIISGEAGGQPQQELQQDLHHQPPGIDMKLTPTPREFFMTAKSEQKKCICENIAVLEQQKTTYKMWAIYLLLNFWLCGVIETAELKI